MKIVLAGGTGQVGQVLRHRSALTTSIYAKVDQDAFAVLARPWPDVASEAASGDAL